MRDLTKAEIEEYLDFAREDHRPPDFKQEQFQLIGDVAIKAGLFKSAVLKMVEAKGLGLEPEEVLMSMWVWAFEMGRECESRLITKALKASVA